MAQPPSSADAPARNYFPGLDGLRTVAFMMVFVFHALWTPGPFRFGPLTWTNAAIVAGMNGVPVFFVLSAFLITRLLLVERERTGGVDIRAFYVRRCLRIWPLYFLVVLYVLAGWVRRGVVYKGLLLSIVTFTVNWYEAFGHPSIPGPVAHLWSLAVEEQFYLVWPFVLLCLSRRQIAAVSVGMVAVALASRLYVGLTQVDGRVMWYPSTTHLDSLAYGTLLALGVDRIPRLRPAAWYAAFVALGLGFIVQARYFAFLFTLEPFGPRMALGFAFVPLLSMGMVALAVNSERTLLAHPWTVWFGRLTYGMYMVHLLVIEEGRVHHLTRPQLFLTLLPTLALAYASLHLYEKPFLRLKRRFERVTSRPDGALSGSPGAGESGARSAPQPASTE